MATNAKKKTAAKSAPKSPVKAPKPAPEVTTNQLIEDTLDPVVKSYGDREFTVGRAYSYVHPTRPAYFGIGVFTATSRLTSTHVSLMVGFNRHNQPAYVTVESSQVSAAR